MSIRDFGVGQNLQTGPSVDHFVVVKLLTPKWSLPFHSPFCTLSPSSLDSDMCTALDSPLVPSASPGGMWWEWQRWGGS